MWTPSHVVINREFSPSSTRQPGAKPIWVFNTANYVKVGGLVSYGPSYEVQFAHAADIVDKILRGTKPGDIPVEQADKFELVINLKTAKALGLTIPESFLLRADDLTAFLDQAL